MSITLFEVAQEFKSIAEQLADTELPADVIRDTLDGERFPVEQKARAVIAVYQNMGAEAEAIESAAKKLAERAKSIRNRQDHLKQYLLSAMQMAGITKIEALDRTFKATLQKERDASIDVFEEQMIPLEYCAIIPSQTRPDKALIKKAITDGFEVPGARIVKKDRLTISM